jgi:hypothetical protein
LIKINRTPSQSPRTADHLGAQLALHRAPRKLRPATTETSLRNLKVLSICPGLPCLHRHTAHSTARFATPLLYTILRLPPPILPLLRPYSVVAKSEIPPTFGFRPCFRPILRVPPHLPTPAPLQRRARPPCYVPATSLLCPPAATLPHAPDSVPQCNPPRDASVWYCLPAVSGRITACHPSLPLTLKPSCHSSSPTRPSSPILRSTPPILAYPPCSKFLLDPTLPPL